MLVGLGLIILSYRHNPYECVSLPILYLVLYGRKPSSLPRPATNRGEDDGPWPVGTPARTPRGPGPRDARLALAEPEPGDEDIP